MDGKEYPIPTQEQVVELFAHNRELESGALEGVLGRIDDGRLIQLNMYCVALEVKRKFTVPHPAHLL